MTSLDAFDLAHTRLLERYLRRFPANPRGWFAALVYERWYRRGNCHIVRERLGRVSGDTK